MLSLPDFAAAMQIMKETTLMKFNELQYARCMYMHALYTSYNLRGTIAAKS